ncbi:hypothetical protein M878_05440 [Streptomyces roseochromogenus subsp. oscitans DS 12.976]|uniref:Uncharacterized protein n=2 Tax=Streptomyces roseochromogenus subsp. oscitans TaxID=149682 RepID=V6L2P6_STRRC|nr:unknown [Streptomyces roseochromogenus subsp. oscitans DS 12.976]EST35504.1 hypothetical protein M878_05440 [Streptomyces roseochromogenus subsp. oscitans DS 12.976]
MVRGVPTRGSARRGSGSWKSRLVAGTEASDRAPPAVAMAEPVAAGWLRAVAAELARRQRDVMRVRRRTMPAENFLSYRKLSDHWLQFPNGDLLTPRLRYPVQRRAAVVRLIQMVSAMGVHEAARFLGVPDTRPERRAGHQRLPIALFLNDRKIELLANRISDTTCTTDQRHRRISLATRTLPPTHRATVWGQVAPRPDTTPPLDSPRKHQPPLTEYADQFVSTIDQRNRTRVMPPSAAPSTGAGFGGRPGLAA